MQQDHPDPSVRRQCGLLSLARSGPCCQPRGESAENLKFMAIIDRQFLETPWRGARAHGATHPCQNDGMADFAPKLSGRHPRLGSAKRR